MGGLVTEVCLAFAVVDAVKADYDVTFVTDAAGGRSQIAHRTAIERMSQAAAVPNTAIALVCELFRDWASPLGGAARDLVNWYVNEVDRWSATVGFVVRERVRIEGVGRFDDRESRRGHPGATVGLVTRRDLQADEHPQSLFRGSSVACGR